MKITMMEMAELSYSEEYRDYAIEAFGASLKSAEFIVSNLIGFTDFLEENGYELAI